MPVISSSYSVEPHAQEDGRVWVTETHTLSAGAPVVHTYLGNSNADFQGIMEARVAFINEQLAETEVTLLIEEPVLTLNHQTAADFASRFWERLRTAYRNGDKFRYHYMVWRVWRWVQDGYLTSEQVRVSFNAFFGTSYASGTEWNSFVTTRMVPIKDRYLALVAETELG